MPYLMEICNKILKGWNGRENGLRFFLERNMSLHIRMERLSCLIEDLANFGPECVKPLTYKG